MDRWSGKVALVTGAGSGIGAAITEELAKNGINVFGFDIKIERVEELKLKIGQTKGDIIPIQGDVRKEKEVVSAFQIIKEKFGVIHILINNAGILRLGSLKDGNPDLFKEVMDVNFMGYVLCAQQALKLMKENNVNDGHIVNINSVSGHKVPGVPNFNVYAASKHAVTALTEILRKELLFLKTKIRVTSISPGLVDTNIGPAAAAACVLSPDDQRVLEALANNPSLKPKDIANAILYALSAPPHVQVHEIMINRVGATDC